MFLVKKLLTVVLSKKSCWNVCLLFKEDVQQYHQWFENHFMLRDPNSHNNLKYKPTTQELMQKSN